MSTAGFTVDIDTGGTFTDGFFTGPGAVHTVKVDTTPHDLTVCFMNCITAGARRFGFEEVSDFLRRTDVIRFSSTVGTNAIIQESGPKVGLLVSEGHEQDLYTPGGKNPLLGFLVPEDMVVGLKAPINPDQVRTQVRELLLAGARVLVVSLKGSDLDPGQEREVKRLILQEYPQHYLGAVPVLLGSEATDRAGDGLRTNAAVINAYCHPPLVRNLYKAEEDLRKRTFLRKLLITHANGGAARVAKTRAIDTYSSGPVAGLLGAAAVARTLGLKDVVTVDVGGTSTDVGLIRDRQTLQNLQPEVAGIPINIPIVNVSSIGGGGGSIARAKDGKLTLGPDSAGASPGPVCYEKGNSQPTVTDADVTLGLINPDFFLAGTRRLNKEKAVKAIESRLAGPLSTATETAAWGVKRVLADAIARDLLRVIEGAGGRAGDFAMFSFGGGGGTCTAMAAERAGIHTIYVFPFSSVFSAFGSSSLDVAHTYERRASWDLAGGEVEALLGPVRAMQEVALKDMRGEGFDPDKIQFDLELEAQDRSGGRPVTISVPAEKADRATLTETYDARYRTLTGAGPVGGVTVSAIRLRASAPVPHVEMPVRSDAGPNAGHARKGSRPVYWGSGWIETPVYGFEQLQSGNRLAGPAVIEAVDTTYAVPGGWSFRIDNRGNGVLERGV